MKHFFIGTVSKTKLIAEWDYESNIKLGLNPDELSTGSGKKAWWICSKCGHKWQTQINVRGKGHGCPHCGHLKVGKANAELKDKNKSLLSVFPDVVKVWNYKKNGKLKPEDFCASSNKIVWWKCSECGKEWKSSICGRAFNSGKTTCKGCSLRNNGQRFLKRGVNDLMTVNPKIAAEWNYEKNKGITPCDVTAHSIVTVWWVCKNHHEWESSIVNRTKDGYRGCPYCSHRRIMAGESDLATVKPELIRFWNQKKNTVSPKSIAAHSNIKYWWKCEKGHEWTGSPNNMLNKAYCPYCSNTRVLPGFNDLVTLRPDLVSEWGQKNGTLDPKSIMPGSGKKVWWTCATCGHEWKAQVCARAKGSGCPVCKNRVLKIGINDLKTVNPKLAEEWNYEKNKNLAPEDVMAGSSKSVWWKCRNGHEWKAEVASRNQGHFCPYCDANKHTSISEKSIAYYLKKCGVIIEENKKIGRRELDIFIPTMNTAIEYDGAYYHRDKNKDLLKNRLCKKLGVKLIRVREPGLPILRSTSIDIGIKRMESDYSHLNSIICELFKQLGLEINDIDIKRDYNEIYSLFELSEKTDSIKNNYPLLTKEWDYEKNTIDINKVSKGAHIMAWWICSRCGHSYNAMVYQRCGGSGCPYCVNKKVLKGFNDLATTRKDLLSWWNYEKNTSIEPTDVTFGSGKLAWWKCPKGHEWKTQINRMAKRKKCPYCRQEGDKK